jgi:hypothetical protein
MVEEGARQPAMLLIIGMGLKQKNNKFYICVGRERERDLMFT